MISIFFLFLYQKNIRTLINHIKQKNDIRYINYKKINYSNNFVMNNVLKYPKNISIMNNSWKYQKLNLSLKSI